MSSQLLIERPKESSGKSKIIKVAITANGNRVQEQGNLFGWRHEGKVLRCCRVGRLPNNKERGLLYPFEGLIGEGQLGL